MTEGGIKLDYINPDGSLAGSQRGLIISYYDQTAILSPFNIDKTHFSHLPNVICTINDNVIELNNSRLAMPFLIRIWNIKYNGINQASDLTLNFPKKNQYLNDVKLDNVNDINISFWTKYLPSIYAHDINIITEIGAVIHYNNKVTGMVVTHVNDKSIIINTYTLKQIINGQDYNYSNLYYGLSINNHNKLYVKENWELYDNCLMKDDIILTIEDIPVEILNKRPVMFFDKFNQYINFDTWITCMFLEKEKDTLKFKILRNDKQFEIIIPRKPLSNIIQFPYYADIDKMSLEKLLILDEERTRKIRDDIQKNPKILFV